MRLESVGQLSDDQLISSASRVALINPAMPQSNATNAASYTTPWDTIDDR